MSRATDAILASADPQWARVPCAVCGRELDWPAAYACMAPSHVRPLCDRCDGSADIMRRAEDILADIPGLIERSLIPDGVAEHRLDDQVYRFLQSGNQTTLLLTGPTRAGKTTQAVNLIRRWCQQYRVPACYRTETRMLSELKNFDTSGAAAKEMHRLCTAPLLVIDDVGTAHTKSNEWALEQYMRIVDERFRHLKTVLTSNLDLPDLWALPYIDGRIQRRLEGVLVPMRQRRAAA